MIHLYIHADPRHDGWKKMQVHTKRSLTTIQLADDKVVRTTTNTKLTYNLFTPGPSVRLVENLAENQLPLLLFLQVPEVILVHHEVGPLMIEVLVSVQHQNLFATRLPAVDHHRQGIAGLVPQNVHATLRLYLVMHPRAPFECHGIALEQMLPYAT